MTSNDVLLAMLWAAATVSLAFVIWYVREWIREKNLEKKVGRV